MASSWDDNKYEYSRVMASIVDILSMSFEDGPASELDPFGVPLGGVDCD